jgi:hypothetical protein
MGLTLRPGTLPVRKSDSPQRHEGTRFIEPSCLRAFVVNLTCGLSHRDGLSRVAERCRSVRISTLAPAEPLDAVVQRYQGGGFVSIDCTPENRRSAGLHGQ